MPDTKKKPAKRNCEKPGFAAARQLKCNIARSNLKAGKVTLAPIRLSDPDE